MGCGTTSGASAPLLPGPCGPGTSWIGDTCVVSCAAPVSTAFVGINNSCLLPDGGLGNCADGACLAPADPTNCGGLGLICPLPWGCYSNPPWNVCGSQVHDKWTPFSCGAGTCPEAAPDCVPDLGCVSSCGPCSDNQSCVAGDAGLGFCCAGACQAFGSDPDNCTGCGLGCEAGTTCVGGACFPIGMCRRYESANCHLSDGGSGACCGGRCADPAATCEPVARCSGAVDGALCAFADGGEGECCGSTCSNLRDSENCGGCGVSCGPDAFCAQGYCKPLVDCANDQNSGTDEYGDCLIDGGGVGSCCGAICVDLTRDPQNCGACSWPCPVDGMCVGSSNQTICVNDLGQSLLCDGGLQCPANAVCKYDRCLPTFCDATQFSCSFDGGFGFCCGTQCTTGDLVCGGTCPSGSAPFNDGSEGCTKPDGGPACGPGAACPAGTFCSFPMRQCVPLNSCVPSLHSPDFNLCWPGPSAGGECCEAACVDSSQDPDNCGGCGVVCSTGICLSSFGGFGALWPLCLPAGPTNDCLLSCPAESVCLEGRCINGVSQDGDRPFCLAEDGTIGAYCGPGVCAHLRDDPENCGACGNACGPGQSCVAGSCSGRPGCGNGREGFFCNLDAGPSYACCPSVGCTDTDTDPNNCGYCRHPCPSGSSCVGGVCT